MLPIDATENKMAPLIREIHFDFQASPIFGEEVGKIHRIYHQDLRDTLDQS